MKAILVARLTMCLLTLGVAACGGGGGDNGGTGPAPNTPPVFSSPATAQAPENSAGQVYLAVATDADGDSVEFGIYGGADAASFQISPSGSLSFRTPPDFERPGDANQDNVYEVTLVAGDGKSGTGLALRVTVTNLIDGSFKVRRVGTGFASPMFLTALPDNSGRVLVVERAGRIRILNPATGAIASEPFLDIVGQVSTDGDRGMLGLALAPDYMTSGQAYVFMTALDGSIQVRRYTSPANNREALDAASSHLVLKVPDTLNTRIGGWIGFDATGSLYVLTGDGGVEASVLIQEYGQQYDFGKILKIDPTGDGYPSDPNRNYIGTARLDLLLHPDEILGWGLRNPFRASFDRVTGQLWIGDIGQDTYEEINRLGRFDSGVFFGWPTYEGTQLRRSTGLAGTFPSAQYGHGTGPLQGKSITGGYVYRGPVERLYGHYIFADFVSNNVWSVPIEALPDNFGTAPPQSTAPSTIFTNRNADFTPDAGTLTQIISFGEDQTGNLFIVSMAGSVFMIQPAP